MTHYHVVANGLTRNADDYTTDSLANARAMSGLAPDCHIEPCEESTCHLDD